MSHLEEAAGSLAAAADSVKPETLSVVVEELREAHRFVVAAGSVYENDWGSVLATIARDLEVYAGELIQLRTQLEAEATHLRSLGG